MSRHKIKYNFSVLGYHIDVGEYFRCELDVNYTSKCKMHKQNLLVYCRMGIAIKTIRVKSGTAEDTNKIGQVQK